MAVSFITVSAGGNPSSIRVPFLREGEIRGEVRGTSGLVRLNDPGGERVRRFRSSFAVVKKSGMATSTNVRKNAHVLNRQGGYARIEGSRRREQATGGKAGFYMAGEVGLPVTTSA